MNVTILNLLDLPDHLRDNIWIPGNDCYVNCYIETDSKEQILEYFEEDKANDKELTFDKWLTDGNGQDFEISWWIFNNCADEDLDADKILWEICW